MTDLYAINFSEFMISKNLLKVHIYSKNIDEKFKVQANKFDFDNGVSGHVKETKDVAEIKLMCNEADIKDKIFKLDTETD